MENMKDLFKYIPAEEIEKLKKSMEKHFLLAKDRVEFEDGNGYKFIPGFSPSSAQYAYENLEIKEGDVFVVSYPKTGTNWTLEVVRQILFQDPMSDQISKNIPLPLKLIEVGTKERFELLNKLPLKRRQFGSHLPAALMNVEAIKKANAKVVYVLRNPKDQILSFYNFMPKMPTGEHVKMKPMFSEGWNKYFEHVVAGDFPMISKPGEWYPEHILSWYQHKDNKNVYFLYYEDMKKDLCKEIKLLAEYLNVPITEEKVEAIKKACSFDEMKKTLTKGDDMQSQLSKAVYRKGAIGGWKDHFTVSQSERVDEIMKEKLKDTDITFTYE